MILAVGSFAEWRTVPGYGIVVLMAVGSAIVLSCLSLVFARRAVAQATALAVAARNDPASYSDR
jgi:hypothetical protein